MTEKRGGNLCAPVPRGTIGKCGYINDVDFDRLKKTLTDYKELCMHGGFARQGAGVDMHCHDVGLQDPSTTAKDAPTLEALKKKDYDSKLADLADEDLPDCLP